MRLLGWEIQLRKAAPAGTTAVAENRGGWFGIIRESFAGAWQRGAEIKPESVLAHHAIFACITLIAQDVGKLRPKLVQKDENGIWREITSPAFSTVLKRPNHYQNHIQFKEWWITSKLVRGNTYALIERDNRSVVRALYLLDPTRVTVLVAPNGDIYYRLNTDHLSRIEEAEITVPASEILHDRINCLFHPLVGVSPIFASGQAAMIGLKAQANSASFFGNGSNPGGILTTPQTVDKPTAERIREEWNAKFAGENSGRVAVLGNDMKFEPMRMTAVDSQMIEHLEWSAETVCSTFHVPPFKVGLGQMPTYQNGEVLNQIYYSDGLQSHIESFEAVMDAGLGLLDAKDGKQLGIELDLKALLRMDTATQVKTLGEGVKGAIMTPNEARRELDLAPITGGDTVYLQQQNFSLAALDARDRSDNPFERSRSAPTAPAPAPTEDAGERDMSRFTLKVLDGLRRAA